MYAGEEEAVKRVHRIIKPRRCELYKGWRCPLLFLKKPYYLNIYFNSQFYITEIHTKQKRLRKLYKQDKAPKSLYRIINPKQHKSLLYLFYQLNFKAPKSFHKIYLQLNNREIVAKGQLIILKSRQSYCLKLHILKQRKTHPILDTYQSIPTHIKKVGYKLYDDIHEAPFMQPINVATVFENYPYSRTVLYNYFQRVIGTTPSTVWRDRRLISYAYHLLDTDDSITDSYAQFGFTNTSHLHRNFKQRFHISPLDFRNKYSGF